MPSRALGRRELQRRLAERRLIAFRVGLQQELEDVRLHVATSIPQRDCPCSSKTWLRSSALAGLPHGHPTGER